MTQDLHTDAADTAITTAGSTAGLHRLYSWRFAFAAVWAGLFAVSASSLTPVSVALLMLYPLADLAAAAVDLRSSATARPRGPLYVNLVLSLLATVALGVAASSGTPDVLRAWGIWAIATGVVQVVVATRRSRLRGQRVMVLSGSLSVVAGSAFVVMAAGADASLTGLAGYAALGGIFFLISAIRLRRAGSATR